jgi:hypothetical protein
LILTRDERYSNGHSSQINDKIFYKPLENRLEDPHIKVHQRDNTEVSL